MNSLFLILLFIFGGVALMVVLGEKFAKPMEPEKCRSCRAGFFRWSPFPLLSS